MNAPLKLAVPLLAALAVAACNAGGSSNLPGSTAQTVSQGHSVPYWQSENLARRVCPEVQPGYAQCDALIVNRTWRARARLSRLEAGGLPKTL